MKRIRPGAIGRLLVLAILLTGPGPVAAQTPRAFVEGVKAYDEGHYRQAIASFRKLADTGIQNGKLFYNLGNAYLKSNDLGHAVLWYERALRLIPGDPDLKFNYAYAAGLLQDKREDTAPGIYRILFFWKYIFSRNTVIWLAIGLNLTFWVFMAAQKVRRRRPLRHACLVLAPFVALFTLTALDDYYAAVHMRKAVVLEDRVAVRSGFSDTATELFVLHAGTRVTVEQQRKGYWRISFSEDKIGWIKQDAAGLI